MIDFNKIKAVINNLHTGEGKTYSMCKYIKENNSHVRQYFIHCSSDSGASIELLCALPDEKDSHDSSSITLMSKQSNERVLLFLNCLKR